MSCMARVVSGGCLINALDHVSSDSSPGTMVARLCSRIRFPAGRSDMFKGPIRL